MHIQFKEKDPNKVLEAIRTAMGDRELGKIVSFDMDPSSLTVTISKLGKSTLTFLKKATDAGIELVLDNEKIAMTHKAFKGEVTDKILKIIEKAGGSIKRG